MTQSESVKKSSSPAVNETLVIYVVAAALLTMVWVIAFLGWQS